MSNIVYKCPAKTHKQCLESIDMCPPGFCKMKPRKYTDVWREVNAKK